MTERRTRDVDPVATLDVVCPHHLDSVIATYVIYLDPMTRSPRIFAGGPGLGRQMIVTDDARSARVLETGAESPLPEWLADPGEHRGWFREVLRCPRPSCNYRADLRMDEWREQAKHLMLERLAQGESVTVLTEPDTPRRRFV